MQKPGAFCWWYVDLVDDAGDGIVLIWSFGLPFLPGMRDRPAPATRPALNVVAYRGGREAFYLLQEMEPDRVEAQIHRWTFDRTVIVVDERGDQVSLTATIDAPVPAGEQRVQGSIRLIGPHCRGTRGMTETGTTAHGWFPFLAGCRGTAELTWGPRPEDEIRLRGRGYFDSNASHLPLDRLGIADWSWGRVGLGTEELIFYQLNPEEAGEPSQDHVFVVSETGLMRRVTSPKLTWSQRRPGFYGLAHHRRLDIEAADIDVSVYLEDRVDDGPFYWRALIRAEDRQSGVTGRGVAELVAPARVDLAWQRPFVRMRRHALGGSNSMWLPLFCGGRRGRVSRLVTQIWTRPTEPQGARP